MIPKEDYKFGIRFLKDTGLYKAYLKYLKYEKEHNNIRPFFCMRGEEINTVDDMFARSNFTTWLMCNCNIIIGSSNGFRNYTISEIFCMYLENVWHEKKIKVSHKSNLKPLKIGIECDNLAKTINLKFKKLENR